MGPAKLGVGARFVALFWLIGLSVRLSVCRLKVKMDEAEERGGGKTALRFTANVQ